MRKRVVGKLVVGIGVIHLAASGIFYRDDVLGVIDRGIINAVEPAGAAPLDAGFWYASAGVGVLMYGALIWWYERNIGPVPRFVGWTLAGFGIWGVVLMPSSGFWLFLVPAAVAIRSARQPTSEQITT